MCLKQVHAASFVCARRHEDRSNRVLVGTGPGFFFRRMPASHPEAVRVELLIIAVNPHYFVIYPSHGIVAPLQLGGVFDFRIDSLTQLTLGLDENVT